MPPAQKKSATRGRPKLDDEQQSDRRVRRREDGQRLNDALQSLDLSQSEAARRTGLKRTYLNEIANGERDLGREDLRRLGSLGISSDFLLGRNVDVAWERRATIGALADELRSELVRSRPLAAPADDLARKEGLAGVPPLNDDSAFVLEIITSWWESRFRNRAQTMADRLARLAARLLADAQLAVHTRVAAGMVAFAYFIERDVQAIRTEPNEFLSRESAELYMNGVRDAWPLLLDAEIGGPLRAFGPSPDRHPNGDPIRRFTIFRVPYERGFSYRSDAADHVWFVDPATGAPTYQTGRFLDTWPRTGDFGERLPIVNSSFFGLEASSTSPSHLLSGLVQDDATSVDNHTATIPSA